MHLNGASCEIKSGLFRCKTSAAGLCQYCGKPFCADHGVFLEEGQEVCNSKNCVAKREDVVAHLVYKEAVLIRNEATQCGIEGCDQAVGRRCGRCEGYFCARHVSAHEDTVIENEMRVERMATLCQHCWQRRPIWLRT
jgi:hypothetical protein